MANISAAALALALSIGLLASACSSPPTCTELDATARAASDRYDAAVTAEDIADAKVEFDDAIGQLIDLDC